MILFDSRKVFLRTTLSRGDIIVLLGLVSVIYALTIFGNEWRAAYNPYTPIDLGLLALPRYALFSALRGVLAFLLSLIVSFAAGYAAAKSERAERFILPLLDVMQSIPVLGFLPGLVLGLVALFPNSNIGLELACIVMIFTGQVWNLAFAFYSSLKAVPADLKEVALIMGLSPSQKFQLVEFPYSAANVTLNGMMSMAGGWFFLSVCESFTLGQQTYRIPGLGSYMAVALDSGDLFAIVAGLLAMACVIFAFDKLLWSPAFVWAHRYRLEERPEDGLPSRSPFVWGLARGSLILKFFRSFDVFGFLQKVGPFWRRRQRSRQEDIFLTALGFVLRLIVVLGMLFAAFHVVRLVQNLSLADWLQITRDAMFTFLRVLVAVVLGTLWALPFGLWVASKKARLRIFQPIIQMLASFPAPMLYPMALLGLRFLKIDFEICAALLMVLGVQWYILFNVIAGALKTPTELGLALDLMNCTIWNRWRYLFLPSILPALITGWITAAGGAWNASIVAEVLFFRGQKFEAHGLGADLSRAADAGDFPRLAACLMVMVLFVVGLNRVFWSRLYKVIHTRFLLD
jgi:NitT/TauT family transport system permease protein